MAYLMIFLGGGAGSLARYALARWALAAGQEVLWGTLAANTLACLLLGYFASDVLQINLQPSTKLLIMVGFCGGFSTFSTFSLEALSLAQNGRMGLAILYVFLSLVLGVAAIASWNFVR